MRGLENRLRKLEQVRFPQFAPAAICLAFASGNYVRPESSDRVEAVRQWLVERDRGECLTPVIAIGTAIPEFDQALAVVRRAVAHA